MEAVCAAEPGSLDATNAVPAWRSSLPQIRVELVAEPLGVVESERDEGGEDVSPGRQRRRCGWAGARPQARKLVRASRMTGPFRSCYVEDAGEVT